MNFDPLPGWKTYLAAAGLVGLAVYDLSQNNINGAYQAFLAALAAFGIKQAIERKK